jgi:glycosyltransferase involved in cell wall biosynthesis
MPIYNAEKYLHYSLRSIQNQKMKELEIILIDDCSTDDSVKIIEEYMKEDPRIRLLKNEKNRRILYSKSIAALNANGKYITQIDQDDMLIRDDAFDLLYNECEKNDLDLINFKHKSVKFGFKNI